MDDTEPTCAHARAVAAIKHALANRRAVGQGRPVLYVAPRIYRKAARYAGFTKAKWRFVRRQWNQQRRRPPVTRHLAADADGLPLYHGIPVRPAP